MANQDFWMNTKPAKKLVHFVNSTELTCKPKLGEYKYLLRFDLDRKIVYNFYGSCFRVPCWVNDKGHTFRSSLNVDIEKVEEFISNINKK